MKRNFTRLLCGSLLAASCIHPFSSSAQVTGPSSSQSPYLVPVESGVKITSMLTAADTVNGYIMSGVPDGLGAYDNHDGTFTLLMNHEILNTAGVARAHGSMGSFVSKWIINKQDLSFVNGQDLIQEVKLWNGTGYDTYNALNPSSLAAFSRFCSGDLPAASALYNSVTGMGTQERIYMNGEEVTEGRAMAHIVTGPEAGTSYQLPAAGRMSFENQLVNPYMSDKTIVGETDDASITTSNVYFYIGTKTNTGNDIEKAGLTNGVLYGLKISGYPQERISSSIINDAPAAGTTFELVMIPGADTLTGVELDAAGLAAGATYFSRSEDGAWDPSNLSDFYFHTTDQIDQVNDAIGTQIGRSRLWHLHFTDINNPELGGTVEAVLNGSEGQNMLDNLTIDKAGHITLVEDVGNSAHNGKVWDYNIATDELIQLSKHDVARFGDVGIAATAPYNQDEESSGVLDAQSILGPGMYLIDDQAHYTTGIPANVVEGGQLLTLYNPNTADCSNYTAAVYPAGTNDYCQGSAVTLTANGGYGFTYQWYRGNAAILGATSSSYTTTLSGNFHVVESNGSCSWNSPISTIHRINAPLANISSPGGLNLCGSGLVSLKAAGGTATSSYAWYKDGVLLSGITSRKIITGEAGSYTVTITNTNSCASASPAAVVYSSCKQESAFPVMNADIMTLYPNPASDNFIINFDMNNDYNGIANIEMYNVAGQLIMHAETEISGGSFQSEMRTDRSLENGTYSVRVLAGDQSFVKQIVIVH